MSPETFQHRYRQTRVYRGEIFTRNAVVSVLSKVTAEQFQKHFSLKIPSSTFNYGTVDCSHASLHVAGRYRKFSRNLCQTPWIIDGEKRMETSTQELIVAHLEPFFKVQSKSS